MSGKTELKIKLDHLPNELFKRTVVRGKLDLVGKFPFKLQIPDCNSKTPFHAYNMTIHHKCAQREFHCSFLKGQIFIEYSVIEDIIFIH